MTQSCLDCPSKACKVKGADCFGVRPDSLAIYRREPVAGLLRDSSSLVDGGRAGRLSRFEEVVEFCRSRGYGRIGLAYCFGLELVALDVRDKLSAAGLDVLPARCTLGGVKERQIDTAKAGEAISCNPAGQALFLNSRVDFVIEMGLCLGHDVLFHQELTRPFTVLIVKDRVHHHDPLRGIRNFGRPEPEQTRPVAEVLRSLPMAELMKGGAWLQARLQEGDDLLLLDLRGAGAFDAGHIAGSVRVSLHELPDGVEMLVARRSQTVVCICNGSVQSALAAVLLRSEGLANSHALSGGYSGWVREGRPV